MASAYSSTPSLQAQADTLSRRVKQLINTRLKAICKQEKLGVTGVKATLQQRVIDHIHQRARSGDTAAIARLTSEIHPQGNPPPTGAPAYNLSSSPPAGSHYTMTNGYTTGAHGSSSRSHLASHQRRINYKKSPFYEILESVTKELEIPKLEGHRQSLALKMELLAAQVDRMKTEQNLRIMLFCAGDPIIGSSLSSVDIAFPHQLEIKVNNEEVKANYKGLKNKPGTTRPVDITSFCRTKVAGAENNISVMFALTSKKYYMQGMLVKKHSVKELTDRIQNGNQITKQRVINEMLAKANDPDIEATSTTLSLKDPISTLRLRYPCRSITCYHNQCFDAMMFLELQEQAPTWTCPVCNKVVVFEGLAVDQYVEEILRETSKSTEQVTIEPNGVWKVSAESTSNSRNSAPDDDDDDSDDLVEISGYRLKDLKAETPVTPYSFTNTPPLPDPTSATRNGTGGAGSKRKAEVIDLTLSDDDAPAPKRPVHSSARSSSHLHDPLRNGYLTPTGGSTTLSSNVIDPFRINSTSSNHGFSLPQPSRTTPQQGDYSRGYPSTYNR
ncbi:hypothetical protein NA57DRAFT_80973 [Rhizodiscina lignyota]|uniref:PINIT domain-containing protein n=1 Tax=Rhizodiscina lignyota TaxID=1504668 RepID=A0A9P4I6R1_9PEZI|nr:hypothetical protein NA57DRAFT_80973 [Rhizodiscina lignyota]